MIKKPPLLLPEKKSLRMIKNLPIDFGVNYAIVIAVILAFVSMFKPEISALKERIKINFKNKNMTKQDPSTYTTAKFMSELSGIPMNYEEKYPTLNSMCYSTKHKPPKEK
jgi:hypothetical protein